jgi:hypothetical protein
MMFTRRADGKAHILSSDHLSKLVRELVGPPLGSNLRKPVSRAHPGSSINTCTRIK